MKKNHEISGDHSSTWSVRLVSIALVIAIVLIAFEGASWVVYYQRDYVRNVLRDIGGIGGVGQLHLDSYEMADPQISGHWRLRPNFVTSSEALIAEKSDAGKWLGAAAVRETRSNDDLGIFKINSAGFKGPELDATHRCPRILALGDSVTFGIGGLSYPHYVRAALAEEKINAEVINAGVEGYNPQNILNEMPRYLALKPEIVTIYIGWNSIFDADIDTIGAPTPLKSLWLIRNAVGALDRMISVDASRATRTYHRELQPNAENPLIKDIRSFNPAYLGDITKMINSFRAINAQVYLITLMGLYQTDQAPSPAALKVGHLPSWTDNPFVLAASTERHNDLLKVEADREGVHLIDLQTWGREHMNPPEAYFYDSVHFNARGLQQVGAFLASMLVHPVRELKTICNLEG